LTHIYPASNCPDFQKETDEMVQMGKSPLHHAAARGRVATVRVLLELKADLNQTTKARQKKILICFEVTELALLIRRK